MRYDVKKFLFIGLEKERVQFFQHAQEAGIVHFIDMQPSKTRAKPSVYSESSFKIQKAIKIVRGLPIAPQEEVDEYEIADGLVQKIIGLKEHLEALYEEERLLNLEMSRVAIFGDFSLEEVQKIEREGHRVLQFFAAKFGHAESAPVPENLIYIGSDHGLDYFVAINKVRTQYPKMIEMLIDRPYGELKKRYQEVQQEIRASDQRLKGYAKYNRFLHHAFIYSLNKTNLEQAKGYVQFPLEEGELFVVEGWVPVNKIKELYQFAEELKVYIEEIHIEEKDQVPTSLQNQGAARIGQDILTIYDTPSPADRDPSLWVLVFFSLFFSMIIGDGGYGLILLLIALYIRYKHQGLQNVKKRVLDLVTILAFCCIAWGVMTTSFFGITFAPDNPIRKVSLMSWLVEKKVEYHIALKDDVYQEWVKKYPQVAEVKDPTEFLIEASHKSASGQVSYEVYNKFSDNIMMEFALFIGVLHIILSMGRYLDRNPQNLGWIIFLIGAYLYAPSFLHAASFVNYALGVNPATAAANGLYLIYIGVGLAVVIALFKHHWFGILEASVVIQIFADVLSYLRLYALGLAGSLLTATMNDLAAGVPIVFGILILLLGHCVNLVLCIMGGVIHGLRLNFLEWYHWSFEGGGKIFNPLRKLKVE
jgi:V/A-type H+/Na+-transporting ATPase subunit I